jgi:hypothetical protein
MDLPRAVSKGRVWTAVACMFDTVYSLHPKETFRDIHMTYRVSTLCVYRDGQKVVRSDMPSADVEQIVIQNTATVPVAQ